MVLLPHWLFFLRYFLLAYLLLNLYRSTYIRSFSFLYAVLFYCLSTSGFEAITNNAALNVVEHFFCCTSVHISVRYLPRNRNCWLTGNTDVRHYLMLPKVFPNGCDNLYISKSMGRFCCSPFFQHSHLHSKAFLSDTEAT